MYSSQTLRRLNYCVILLLTCLLVQIPWSYETQAKTTDKVVRLAYVEWSSEIASSHLVKAVIEEKFNYRCQLISLTAEEMWHAVASGKADATVSAWLPETHAHYYREVKDSVVNLGPNLEGTKTGLVIPNITAGRFTAGTGIRNRPYMDVQSISGLQQHIDKLNGKIIGIDPEAGVMRQTREAMEVYGLEEFRLVDGDEESMIDALSDALRHQEWIVVTGWLPHWMFARWDLKFLKDPENVYGGGGHINTIVREGLQSDMPDVYRFLDNFHWKPEEMGQLMLWIQERNGRYPYESALRWIRTHPDRINRWIP